MFTLRAIKPFLVIGSFVMTTMLFSACSARVVPAVVSNRRKYTHGDNFLNHAKRFQRLFRGLVA